MYFLFFDFRRYMNRRLNLVGEPEHHVVFAGGHYTGQFVARGAADAGISDFALFLELVEQRRCWTFIDDALDGLVSLALSDKAVGEIFNLGSHFE